MKFVVLITLIFAILAITIETRRKKTKGCAARSEKECEKGDAKCSYCKGHCMARGECSKRRRF